MTSAPVPENETARLEALNACQVLDTTPEQAFDDLVKIAASVCSVPIALVSLIDETRQWFKAKVGLDVSETPRQLAFCAHAILESGVMIVPDASIDPRFADNPLVTADPHIRFYAGVPLETDAGYRLGTLCVIDRKPRRLTAVQIDLLERLSRQVIRQLELRALTSQLSRSSEELRFMQQVVDQTQEPMYLLAPDQGFRFVYVNDAACRHFGHSRESLLHMCVPDWDPDVSLEQCRENWRQIKRHKSIFFETRHRLKNDEVVPVEIHANYVVIGGKELIAGTIHNISERKQAAEALLEKDRHLDAAQAIAHLGSWDWDIHTGREIWSDEQYRIFGYEPGSVNATYDVFVNALHPDDRQRVLAAVNQALEQDQAYDVEFRIRRPHGDERIIRGRGLVERDADGRAVRMRGTALDVTAERLAQRDRDLLMYAVDHGMEGVALLDGEGRFTYLNQAHAALYGFTVDELIGRTWRDLYEPETILWIERQVFPLLLREGQWTGELLGRKQDGARFDVEISLRLLGGPIAGGQEVLACTCRDVTERKRAEMVLQQAHVDLERGVAERTADLGEANRQLRHLSRQLVRTQEMERRRLASDLHDEIGQALTALNINLQVLKAQTAEAESGPLEESLQLSSRLLLQVRQLAVDLRPHLLDELGLVGSLKAYVARQGERNGWLTRFDMTGEQRSLSDELEVTCYRIVQESLTNAARHSKAAAVAVRLEWGPENLELSVADDGVGFDAGGWRGSQTAGHGSGLRGMEERVHLAGGRFHVESAPQVGCTVHVRIPLGHETVEVAEAEAT